MSCAPGTSECLHFCWTHEQSSHHRSAWHLRWCLKVPLHLGTQSFLGWGCFLSSFVGSQSNAIIPPGDTLDHLATDHNVPSGSWAKVLSLDTYSCIDYTEFVMVMCIDSHMSGTWPPGELSYIYQSFLSKKKFIFCITLQSWSLGGWPMPADGVADR